MKWMRSGIPHLTENSSAFDVYAQAKSCLSCMGPTELTALSILLVGRYNLAHDRVLRDLKLLTWSPKLQEVFGILVRDRTLSNSPADLCSHPECVLRRVHNQ